MQPSTPARYLITAALPYANGLKHIGHLAGAYLPADIYVRYLRANKKDVVFVCGSDENGAAITIQAFKENTTPRAIVDKYHAIIEQNFKELQIAFDIYHRTSSPLHHQTAQDFFTSLYEQGFLEEKETTQLFDEQANLFLADRYVVGTCPICGNSKAYGDQCEKCGTDLSPEQLINPKSAVSGNTPIQKKTTHWYLPLKQYELFLTDWLNDETRSQWKPNVLGQCKSWLNKGLQSRAVTRDLDWGIPVPLATARGKVLYVWFDAPIGYISATKQWALQTGKDWKPYWQSPDTQLVHFIGKDNIVFHCIIFPVMLHLHQNILPTQVPANEFMNLEGDKMSTSAGWSIEMQDYITDWITPQPADNMGDVLRYYLTTISPETKDSEFTWKGFQTANNSELVSIFGNFVNRTFVLMHKLCNGKVPPRHIAALEPIDQQLIDQLPQTAQTVGKLIEQYSFREALFAIVDLARKGNKYLQEQAPWLVAKDLPNNPLAQQKIDNCLHHCLQLCANLAILIEPFMPATAQKLCHLMKVTPALLEWKNAGTLQLLSVGYTLRPPELLFRKIEDEEIAIQLDKLTQKATQHASNKEGNKVPATPFPPCKPLVDFADFEKLDIRLGTILEAEKIKNTDKLLKLLVDVGFEKRTIVSGIAQHVELQNLINQQVLVVVNLKPRNLKGIQSNGMILMAKDENGKLHFTPPTIFLKSGAVIN